MRNSHKLIMSSIAVMLVAMKPEIASFIPQWVKLGAAGSLLILGLLMMWKERQW